MYLMGEKEEKFAYFFGGIDVFHDFPPLILV